MSNAPKLFFDFAAVTDIGCERSNNEDSYGYDTERHLYVVCDGMGGRSAGEVASAIAVRTLIESFASSASSRGGADADLVENRLMEAILETNRAVRAAGAGDSGLNAMGTTLVCVCLDGERAVIGNVGDSRAYLIRNGSCVQITQDHSLLAEAVRAGEITPEAAAISNLQSIITRAIGVEETVEPDLYAAQMQVGDVLLLASDGLTRYAQPHDILAALTESADLAGTCHWLVAHAKQCGGADNITCILLRASESLAAPQVNGDDQAGDENAPPDEMKAFNPMI